jgi:prepilin-type N-terminal cleavage/methylation domain-containing protein
MLARIRKAKEENEGGFTLIELLVVIIIIGILAAIAIPTFLNQRKKGYDAQAKSDLRNVATIEETFFTDNNYYYYGSASGTPLAFPANTLTDYKASNAVTAMVVVGYKNDGVTKATTVDAVPATGSVGGFCAEATSTANNTWVYDSTKGGLLGLKTATVKCP